MSKLRWYQKKAIDTIFDDIMDGNVLISAPTGSGKSHIISGFVERVYSDYPNIKILILAHVKELVEQNASKLDIDLGLYCAGLNKREIKNITVASSLEISSLQLEPFDPRARTRSPHPFLRNEG